MVAIILFNHLTFGGISRILHSIGVPVWKSQAGVFNVFQSVSLSIQDKKSLLAENERLRGEIVRLELASLGNLVIRKENEYFRQILNRDGSPELVVAAILARPNRTLYDTFIVDVGRRDGVVQDALVFGIGGVTIGSVDEVFAHTSRISLYSTPGRKTEVLLGDAGTELVSVEAVGRGGGDFEMHIPRGIEVFEGHAVYSSSLGGSIFGVIEEIITIPSDPFQTILFSSPINIQSLHVVSIELQ
ncbi:rod shape-determining protein MreC [Candidatus Kaiserbacteria bacterium]|nr:rod shape-determining protein MreC [Candidatus Kaiserbacteria bacterium]